MVFRRQVTEEGPQMPGGGIDGVGGGGIRWNTEVVVRG